MGILNLMPGNTISCEYTALSGTFGTFSNITKASKPLIPVSGATIPDGSFNFIFVGYDLRGRLKLIADRNIQVNITWDTLNSSGLCSITGVQIPINGKNYTMRLMTGGIAPTDTDNEWSKIIAEYNLGGAITAGDNSLWNWNGVYSWCLETPPGYTSNRVARGSTAVTTWYTNGYLSSTSSATVGFRPILLIDANAVENPILIKTIDNRIYGKIYKY